MSESRSYMGIKYDCYINTQIDTNIELFVKRYAGNLVKNGIIQVKSDVRPCTPRESNTCIFNPYDARNSQYLTPFSVIELEYPYVNKCMELWGRGLDTIRSGGIHIILKEAKRTKFTVAHYCPLGCMLVFPTLNFSNSYFEEYMVYDMFDKIFENLNNVRNLQSLNFPKLVDCSTDDGDKPSLRLRLGNFVVAMDVTSIKDLTDFREELKKDIESAYMASLDTITKSQLAMSQRLNAHYNQLLADAGGISYEFVHSVYLMHGYIAKVGDVIAVSIPSGSITVDKVFTSGSTFKILENLQKTFQGYFVFEYDTGNKNVVNRVWFSEKPDNGYLDEDTFFETYHSYFQAMCLGSEGERRIVGHKGIPDASMIEYLRTLLTTVNWDSPVRRNPEPHAYWRKLTKWIVTCTTNFYREEDSFFGVDKDHQICSLEKKDKPTYINDDGKEVSDAW